MCSKHFCVQAKGVGHRPVPPPLNTPLGVMAVCLQLHYTLLQKGEHQNHGGNSVNSQPIFKIISPVDSPVICSK